MKNFFTIFEEYLDEIKHLLLSKLLLKLKSLVFLLPTACIVLINTEQHVAAKHNHLHIAFKACEKLLCGMYNLQCKQTVTMQEFSLTEIHKHTCKWQYNCNKRLYCCYNKQASKALINSLPLCNRAINIDTHCCWSVHYHLQCFVACTKCARNEQRTSLNTFNSLQHQMHKSLERLVARGRCMRELSGEKIYAYCSFKLATVLLLLYKT